VPSELNYSALAVPASLLSEFGGVGGYEHTSSEQPGVDRVCSGSKASIRGRGQENDPDLDSIHVPDLRQVEEHRQDRDSTDDWRQQTQQEETEQTKKRHMLPPGLKCCPGESRSNAASEHEQSDSRYAGGKH
jgi:hypothetical protein